MGLRTVRLDDETEKVLAQIIALTGLTVSAAVKRGLRRLADEVVSEGGRTPYDVYAELDLGPGGYAIAPATEVKQGVHRAVRKKVRR